ncbi:MAG: carboxypeptidase regulatory-like domain-containing protein [Verrucomicrobiia bacterium]
MKTCLKTFIIMSVASVAWFGGEVAAPAQVTLSVSPSVISNTYPGFITLNITGLTNGEQVTVQTYLDLNSNGVVDADEPMMDEFKITDGGASVIGGVTNISVPFDSNSATGAITTSLSFAPPLENIVGQKIYRVVSSPAGAFAPVTAVLEVTNAATGQSVSGMVYSNGVVPLPNAVVVALTATNQNYVASAVADSSGHYFLTLNPGAYLLLPALPGYYTDQSLLPQVTLNNGMSATNNLVLTSGTVAISGQVYNPSNSNVTLGGVFLQLQSGYLFEVAFTDTNGDYTAYATSNNWKISLTSERLARRGYVAPQNSALQVNATLGDVTNASIALYKGNALFYGQLTISNMPVPNITIECNDSNQLFSGKSYTDTNGNYAVAALVDTNVLGPNITWFCSPNTGNEIETVLFNYIVNQTQNVTLTNGQAFLQNFSALPVTATISGRLVNNLGVPLSGISVGASATINSDQYGTAYVDTDTNGDYSFGAASGQWYVDVNCCGSHGLDSQGYYDPIGLHAVTIPPTNAIVNITAYPVGTPFLSQAEQISPTQFGFNLSGSSGNNYTVQASTNLASTNWFTLTIISNLPGNAVFIQDNEATNSQRFYRAFLGP